MNCRDKNRYNSKHYADEAGQRSTDEYGFLTRSYTCPECGGWHIATVKKDGIGVLSLDALQKNRSRGA